MANLSGKVALVTGSSSGIGAAAARALAAEGVKVVVNSTRSVGPGRALAQEIDGHYVQADVADAGEAAALVEQAVAHYGHLDILVNNAGTTALIPHSDIDAATVDVWKRIFDVNVFGTWQVTAAAVPHLRAAGDASVVNVSSIAGHAATGSSIPYASSKAALSHMTVLLANVLGPEVRVNAVAPGLVDTPWTADWEVVRAVVSANAPLRRTGTPEDIAEVIVSLADARYMTGEVVLVDGGLHLFR